MSQIKSRLLFLVGALVALTVRTCQLLFMTEPATGFFYPSYETSGALLTALYIGIIAVTAAVAFSELKGVARRPQHTAVTSVVFALCAVFVAIKGVITPFMGEKLGIYTLFKLIVSLLTVAFFVLEALAVFNIGERFRNYLSAAPVCWWMLQVVDKFGAYLRMVSISEHIFDIAALSSITLFFLFYGKTLSSISTAKSMRFMAPAGVCASLLCLVCSVPRMIVLLMGSGNLLHETATVDPLLIATAVLCLLLIPQRVEKR